MKTAGIHGIREKFSGLLAFLRDKESAVIAFSGGVDSSFLLKAARIADMRVLAVTAVSETVPAADIALAVKFARDAGVGHRTVNTEELSNDSFANNPPERCFYCKDELFNKLLIIAKQDGYNSVFDGTNADDMNDYRPGIRAAEINGIISPLAVCGFSKQEIRTMAKELGLDIWDRPSSPCLSSRFPYGQRITPAALKRVEKAEQVLRDMGLREFRVRDHGDTARIEVGETDMPVFFNHEKRRYVTDEIKSLGYVFVSLDLEGYRSGSMNRVLYKQDT